jgi:fumarate hydratase subunit beta
MSETRKITTPLTDEVVKDLKIGEKISITGVIYSARDAAHKRLVELVEKGEDLPFDLPGSIIYFVGPAPAKPGYAVGSAGPTTSYRMDPYSPTLIGKGLKGMIGKGARSDEVKKAMVEHGAVYFADRLPRTRRRGDKENGSPGFPGHSRHRRAWERPVHQRQGGIPDRWMIEEL